MALFWLFVVTVMVVSALAFGPVWRYRRRRAEAAKPLPASWQQWLSDRWWLYPYLPDAVRTALHRQLQVMVAHTDFYGCNGLTVTEPMKVLTLAQAALMNTGRGRMQWSGFPVVLLYPDAFVREGEVVNELGVVSYERHELLGESWEQGKVVLSWSDIEQDLHGHDSHCLVIHEYAHQLDGRDGLMDGTPPLLDKTQRSRWAKSMQAAYDHLCTVLSRPGLAQREVSSLASIDPYAATNPEEFFAVISEYFFTDPETLVAHYPTVYRELRRFYRLNPYNWFNQPDTT